MPRAVWILIIGQFVLMTGSSFLWPLNSIYMSEHLGKTLSVAGLVLMLNSGTNVVGSLLGGVLFDKLGGYRSILIGSVISIAAIFGLVLSPTWPNYAICLGISGFGSGIVFPSIYALVGSAWKEGGRKPFNAIYVAHNAGVALGSALGGLVASYSFDYVFLANMTMYVVFFLIVLFGHKNIIVSGQLKKNDEMHQKKRMEIKKLYMLSMLCSMFFLCWAAYVQWYTTLAAYTQEINISLKQYSILWTINGILVVAGQPLLQWILRKYNDRLKGQLLVGIGIFVVAFSMAGISNGFKGFVIAMIILTAGEMLVWPVVPTIANHLAPTGREGFYQGIVNSTATAGRMIGPVLGGVLADLSGMHSLFYFMIALLFVAFLLTLFYDRPLKSIGKRNRATT
ncbi:MFS transporter [Bacillus sp. FJAT-49732]|uniref:MFS transporter n=1 Tax=Lederbergia citrisecunda TaxID=2833583 RepID=A0A942YK66_9BACI|nr:MFS transporter [Lederbergia citrisecunda]MBS4200073.1 MFS transporter [Lederbergia citrisecunda]